MMLTIRERDAPFVFLLKDWSAMLNECLINGH